MKTRQYSFQFQKINNKHRMFSNFYNKKYKLHRINSNIPKNPIPNNEKIVFDLFDIINKYNKTYSINISKNAYQKKENGNFFQDYTKFIQMSKQSNFKKFNEYEHLLKPLIQKYRNQNIFFDEEKITDKNIFNSNGLLSISPRQLEELYTKKSRIKSDNFLLSDKSIKFLEKLEKYLRTISTKRRFNGINSIKKEEKKFKKSHKYKLFKRTNAIDALEKLIFTHKEIEDNQQYIDNIKNIIKSSMKSEVNNKNNICEKINNNENENINFPKINNFCNNETESKNRSSISTTIQKTKSIDNSNSSIIIDNNNNISQNKITSFIKKGKNSNSCCSLTNNNSIISKYNDNNFCDVINEKSLLLPQDELGNNKKNINKLLEDSYFNKIYSKNVSKEVYKNYLRLKFNINSKNLNKFKHFSQYKLNLPLVLKDKINDNISLDKELKQKHYQFLKSYIAKKVDFTE